MEASRQLLSTISLYLEMNNIKVSVVNPLVIRRYSFSNETSKSKDR
ncbi:MAG: hypothetical protein R2801_06025 [Chitinophagales bacterium]